MNSCLGLCPPSVILERSAAACSMQLCAEDHPILRNLARCGRQQQSLGQNFRAEMDAFMVAFTLEPTHGGVKPSSQITD